MLIRHSLLYLSGRIIPGAVSLVALAVYTRSLSAAQYGQYALVMASMGIINAVALQWITLSLTRFLAAQEPCERRELLSAALSGYLALAGIVCAAACVMMWLSPGGVPPWAIVGAAVGACGQAWFDMNLQMANAGLAPVRYGLLASAKAVASLAIGVALLRAGCGPAGLIAGLVVSQMITPAPVIGQWRGVSPRMRDSEALRRLLRYGIPLTLTYAMAVVLDVSDRYLIGWFLDSGAVGSYAAAYDVTQQTLGAILGVAHLAAFPLAVQAFERRGLRGAQEQLRRNVVLLSLVGMPAAVGLACTSENIAFVFLGPNVRGAWVIIPIVAGAALVWGMKSYFVDYAFQLTGHMKRQLIPFACAVAANVVLNLFLIPRVGLVGAALATLAAYVIGAVVSWRVGAAVFEFPRLPPDVGRIAVAVLVMGVTVSFMRGWRGSIALAVQVLCGALVYASAVVALNVSGSRSMLQNGVRRWAAVLFP